MGTILHEMLHTVGFYHEQSRPDRDQHIKINFDNIQKEHEHNFNTEAPEKITYSNTTYDLESIMHYGSNYFAIQNNQSTIIVLNGNQSLIGRKKGFSVIDKIEIERYYGCIERGKILNGTADLNSTVTPKPVTKPVTKPITKPVNQTNGTAILKPSITSWPNTDHCTTLLCKLEIIMKGQKSF